ncbi:LPS export ABC transporter permease LptF [Marinicella pacifica]|uniref:Lipopolysaccharide export system permease protein LptF n=1 Tax=Marinicella pacifica TaxID=1171543 RepID=A0A917FNV9_9GAMM|nr:LPS export ABC transporter permease LptF [Marinicella pacifica]GGF92344.1 LPS export ABC transporter permease LptF [Marinicella pacifica]
MILTRYLRKQCAQTTLVVLLLLFLLMVGTLFTSTLRAIARGVLAPDLLFIELSLRSVDVLNILIPLSFYLGVLTALSGLYRNQEAVMMHAFGLSLRDLLKALTPLAVVVFLITAVLALWMAPMAAQLSKELTTRASEEISLMGLSEGKFQNFFSDDGVIYVERIDPKTRRVENIFANIHHPDRIDTITAAYGYEFEENGHKYVALFDGYRNEGVPGTNRYHMMQFKRNDIKLPDLKQEIAALDEQSKTTLALMKSRHLVDQAQFHYRLVPPISVGVLFLLAVSLSKTSHREAKYINLLTGLAAYVLLINLLTIGQSLLAQGSLPMAFGLWWVYVIFVLYAWWRLCRLDGRVFRRQVIQVNPQD